MARNLYRSGKRRRELDKKKKREEKLARKAQGTEPGGEEKQDMSYLEYLHPGGVPEEFLPEGQDDSGEDEDDSEE